MPRRGAVREESEDEDQDRGAACGAGHSGAGVGGKLDAEGEGVSELPVLELPAETVEPHGGGRARGAAAPDGAPRGRGPGRLRQGVCPALAAAPRVRPSLRGPGGRGGRGAGGGP